MWRWSRRLWGARGGLLSLALLAFAPEALAHGGVVSLDVATALGFTASVAAWQAFVTRGRWRDWAWVALAVGFAFNVRFTAVFLPPLLTLLLLAQLLARRVRHPKRAWVGLALLAVSTLMALQVGYLGRTSFRPLREYPFASDLWAATAWQEAVKKGPETLYGKRTVKAYVHRPAFELYDLVNDPHEAKNLADDPKYAEVLGMLKDELKAFQKRTGDPWLLKWERE